MQSVIWTAMCGILSQCCTHNIIFAKDCPSFTNVYLQVTKDSLEFMSIFFCELFCYMVCHRGRELETNKEIAKRGGQRKNSYIKKSYAIAVN